MTWQIQRIPYKSVHFETFFEWLSKDAVPDEKWAIVWDGASIHKGLEVRNFLQNNPGLIHLETLPPYSPKLNAAELLWSYLKCYKLKNQVFLTLDDLEIAVEKALNEIADDPEIIKSFFKKDSVKFL